MAQWLAAMMVLASTATIDAFSAQTPPLAPDYTVDASWAAKPGRDGAAAQVAPGATAIAMKPKVDVFYVHPTTYRSTERWNQDVADPETNAWTDGSVIARQAAIYNGCCRVYAPRYRQASSRAFRNMAVGGEAAFALAYADVLRAFDHYLHKENRGRPFILVGHSQGARHVSQLLEDRIDGTATAKRMVVAYVVGVDLVEGEFGARYKTLSACRTPAATGCVLAWNAILPDADLDRLAGVSATRFVARYGDRPGITPVCINPLTFDAAQPTAPKSASLGAVPGDPDASPLLPLRPGTVSAKCEKGFLVVDPAPDLGLKALPGGSMHYHDFGLFYADVRANIAVRIAAHRRKLTEQ